MRISDWSSDVCSSDLHFRRIGFVLVPPAEELPGPVDRRVERYCPRGTKLCLIAQHRSSPLSSRPQPQNDNGEYDENLADEQLGWGHVGLLAKGAEARLRLLALLSVHSLPLTMCPTRSEEHTSELQSLMRTSYAVFSLKKQKDKN